MATRHLSDAGIGAGEGGVKERVWNHRLAAGAAAGWVDGVAGGWCGWSGRCTAEGFGGPYTSGASDIGTAIIYAVVFTALLALSYYAGPSRYSADYYIEKNLSWWWKVAEMRRPALAQTPALAHANAASAPDETKAELRRTA